MDNLSQDLVKAFDPSLPHRRWGKTKKADAVECHMAIDDVGLLVDELPGRAGLPFT